MSNNAPPRRAHPNPRSARFSSNPSSASSHVLLSHSTFTFIASWQGQLLVCTVVLVLGAIYFFVREPIDQWRRRRREALSRVRERELMEMEKEKNNEKEKGRGGDDDELERDDGGLGKQGARERGREKRKEVKKRKGSLLRPPANTESLTASSIESSPAPPRNDATSPIQQRRSSHSPSPAFSKQRLNPVPIRVSKDANELSSDADVCQSQSARVIVDSSTPPISPGGVPLPGSPTAGPSKLNEKVEYASSNEGAEATLGDTAAQIKTKLDGFSIIPEDGYLPVQTPAGGKKKKRKGKSGAGTSQSGADKGLSDHSSLNDGRRSSVDPGLATSPDISPDPSVLPPLSSQPLPTTVTRPRHQRISSITTRLDLTTQQLRDIVEQRDDTIEALRGEIGLAKAEEAKAREDATRARLIEDRLRADLDKMKRITQKSDNEARRREQDMQSRLAQLHQMYTSAIQRLASFEIALREHGASIPPPPSPLPLQFPQNSPMPMMPMSPYAPSPGRNTPMGGVFMPYPSPGGYPSPMLHSAAYHSHSHGQSHSASPNPFRRSSGMINGLHPGSLGSNDTEVSNLAGPLTPGILSGGGLYGMDIGSSTLPIGAVVLPPAGSEEANGSRQSLAERRRFSIESTVLKKKVKDEKEASGEIIEEENGTQQVNGADGTENGIDPTNNGHPASPSPVSRVNGGLRVLHDGANGNVYYSTEDGQTASSHLDTKDGSDNLDIENVPDLETDNEQTSSLSASVSGTLASASSNGDGESDPSERERERERGRAMVISEPIFASLAHTPEQIEEMRKMREEAVRERQRSASLSAGSGGGNQRKHVGLGMGGLLTPSPSKSPVPLRD
ncbi:hypothetical protein CI109_107130 [Kwoniella shandongensis]|uniref:Uncharacterized protein n=1 Tax=Kwoniella shandongensis TaxID=1734106 RepID=A0A5M6C5M5_9TREE|nr:uncharacterized protein CI109_002413 [Kwoniella shandongensis]KAA5529072.1 hypothetical protein CI109_002413 [Kwoniella shandongensis]